MGGLLRACTGVLGLLRTGIFGHTLACLGVRGRARAGGPVQVRAGGLLRTGFYRRASAGVQGSAKAFVGGPFWAYKNMPKCAWAGTGGHGRAQADAGGCGWAFVSILSIDPV